MLVSWNWLKEYVALDMPVEQLTARLMMAGLNHESTREVGGDLAIDLEVTSNRPDCLGHLGIAREIAVLYDRALTAPAARPAESQTPVERLARVRVECPDLCPRYTARLVRNIRVGPSPRWLARRLETIGLTPINNVVDISNYVLMECGQPLHTFDFERLAGGEIIVRRAAAGETIEAIDHRVYSLGPQMCVIADAERPVAIGGVMGGASTEISPSTCHVLVEAAEFDPISIRTTARALNLHSDSSYRFERRVDPEGVDWASRRCCELILELCGGELAEGVIDVGSPPPARPPITLRLSRVPRVLGIDVPAEAILRILAALGCEIVERSAEAISVIAPSWRRDLTREIDLIEEVARIYGYEKIPEDALVPMFPSHRTREDRVLDKVRGVLTASGFDEAVTLSVVEPALSDAVSPWTDQPALRSLTPVLRGADRLRRSLVPSLLAARRTNESLANDEIELFEIARVYLPQGNDLPREEKMLGVVSGRSFAEVRGALEAVFDAVRIDGLAAGEAAIDLLDPSQSCCWRRGAAMVGYAGRLSAEAQARFDLRGPAVVAELHLAPLIEAAVLVPQYVPLSNYPAVSRDINLVVDENVRWAEIAAVAAEQCGPFAEAVLYRDTYRDAQRLGPEKKSLLFSVVLRSREATLTNQQADDLRQRIVDACGRRFGAVLRAG